MNKRGWIALCTAAALSTAVPFTAATPVYADSTSTSTTYTFSQKSIVLNGQFVMNVMRIVHNNTTYMPVWYLEQVLNKLNIQAKWSASTWELTLPSTITPDLTNISLTAGATAIRINGTTVSNITAIDYQDPNSPGTITAYLPIWYLQDVLLRMGIQSSWNGQTWTLTSGQTPSSGTSSGGSASTVTSSTPPRSTSGGTYNVTQADVLLNGQPAMTVYRIVSNNTTYMPVWYLQEILAKLGVTAKWGGTTWTLTVPSTMQVDLTNIQLGTGHTAVTLNGTAVSSITGLVYEDPNNPTVNTSYLPIWYLTSILTRFGVSNKWNGTARVWGLTTTQTGFNTYDKTGALLGNYSTEADAQNAIANTPGAYVKDAVLGTIVYTTPDFEAFTKSGTLIGDYLTEASAQTQLASQPGGTVKDELNSGTVVYTEPDFAAFTKTGTLIGDYTTEAAAQSTLSTQPGGTVKDELNSGTVVYTEPDYEAFTAPLTTPTDYVTQSAAVSAITGKANGFVVNALTQQVVKQPGNEYKLDSNGLWTSTAYGYLGTVVPPFAQSGGIYLVIDNANSPYLNHFFYLSQNGTYVGKDEGTWENPFRTADLRFASPSGVTAGVIDSWLGSNNSPLQGLGSAFIEAQTTYGVNATYLVAHAIEETGWGRSLIAEQKNNLFGYGAYDSNPGPDAGIFPSNEYAILFQAYEVRNNYLNPGSSNFYKTPTLDGMNENYATSHTWSTSIASLMNQFVDQTGGSISAYTQYSSSTAAPAALSSTEPEYYMNGGQGVVLTNPWTNLPVEPGPYMGGSVTFPGTLTVGSSGPAVAQVQTALNQAGANPQLTVDGQYGPMTQQAVTAYQQAPTHYIQETTYGSVDAATWDSLFPNATSGVAQSLPVGTPVTIDSMQMGMDGAYVTEWYHITAGSVTGWVDSAYISFSNVYRAMASSGYSVPIYGSESTAGAPVDTIHTGDYVVAASPTPDASGFITVQMVNQATNMSYTGYISSSAVTLSKLS